MADFVALISFEHVCPEKEKAYEGFVKYFLNQHQEILTTRF